MSKIRKEDAKQSNAAEKSTVAGQKDTEMVQTKRKEIPQGENREGGGYLQGEQKK